MGIKQFHLVCTFIICLFSSWSECFKNIASLGMVVILIYHLYVQPQNRQHLTNLTKWVGIYSGHLQVRSQNSKFSKCCRHRFNMIHGTGPNFRKNPVSPPEKNFRGFNFRVQRQRELLTTPIYLRRAYRGRKIPRERRQGVVCRFEIAMQCHRQIERNYSAQNSRAKNSTSPMVHAKVHLFRGFGRGSRKFSAIRYHRVTSPPRLTSLVPSLAALGNKIYLYVYTISISLTTRMFMDAFQMPPKLSIM